jgi:hypothetical protein
LTAEQGLKTVEASPVIAKRVNDGLNQEACYWEIKPEEDTWYTSSEIFIYPELTTQTSMYVYQGTDRRNLTTVINSDAVAPIGAPIRVPVNNGAVIVLRSSNTNLVNAGKFSYEVKGRYYNWIEKPFIGLHVSAYYITISLIFIALIMFVTCLCAIPWIPCVTCFSCAGVYCCCCRNKKKKPTRGRRRGR